MPAKTHGELIREPSHTVSALIKRVDTLEKDADKVEAKEGKLSEALADLKTQVVLLQQQFADLKRAEEEGSRRRGVILGAVVGALVGSLVTGLLNYLLSRK